MQMTRREIKEVAKSLGCDLCGIASIDRFENIPSLSHPKSIFPEANSVIVMAKKFLHSTLELNSTIPYTIIRNQLSREIDDITIRLSYIIEEHDGHAIPTGAIEPCNYNKEIGKAVGLISLKHAAYQAGLGVIGKNTLLITPEYGNMVWLGAVVTSLKLEPDRILNQNPCEKQCRICIESCPIGAIDGTLFMDQKLCWNFAFGKENGGEWRIKCFKCRSLCPYSKGYTIESQDQPKKI